jgi:Putative peptidoglycan binding domain
MPQHLYRQGCHGLEVLRIQDALNQRMLFPVNQLTKPRMARLIQDGDFGSHTAAMVREFQRLNRITIDGIVGPETRLHLFPYLSFSSTMGAIGSFQPDNVSRGATPRLAFQIGDPVGEEPKDDPEPQGLVFELSIARGAELKLKNPWPPRFGDAEQKLTIGATILRFGRHELSGELEGSKPLVPKSGDSFKWQGQVKYKYEAISPVGPIRPLSPFVEVVPQSLQGGIGIEASIEIFKDILKFSIDGKGAAGYDVKAGKANAEVTVEGALEFNLDIFFKSHPPAKP